MTTATRAVARTSADELYEAKTAAEQFEHRAYRRHSSNPADSQLKRDWEQAHAEMQRATAVYIDALIHEQATLNR